MVSTCSFSQGYIDIIEDQPNQPTREKTDLLGIPEEDFYDYGCELRAMAKQNGFTHIKFTRLLDVLGLGVSDCMSRSEYMAVADVCRKTMEEVFLPPGFDVDQRIRDDTDVETTYLRHLRSAREDLRWGPNTPPEVILDPALYAAETERVAKGMTKRMLVSSFFLFSSFCTRQEVGRKNH